MKSVAKWLLVLPILDNGCNEDLQSGTSKGRLTPEAETNRQPRKWNDKSANG